MFAKANNAKNSTTLSKDDFLIGCKKFQTYSSIFTSKN